MKQLDTVAEEKDLGIVITRDLKVSQQCKQAYAKASRMLGVINRSIKSKDRDILLSLYKSLVRPHLEYCIPACMVTSRPVARGVRLFRSNPPQPPAVHVTVVVIAVNCLTFLLKYN